MKHTLFFRLLIILCGIACGFGFQFFYVEQRIDGLWNCRLLTALLLGVLLFYPVAFSSAALMKFLTGDRTESFERKDALTFLPLFMLFLLPLQKRFWEGPILVQDIIVAVSLIVVCKCIFLVDARKNPKTSHAAGGNFSRSGLTISAVALLLAVPVFWFHQISVTFPDFFGAGSVENPETYSRWHEGVVRETFPYSKKITFRREAPYENSRAIVGFRIVKAPNEKCGFPIPLATELRVMNVDGELLARKHRLIDATDPRARNWANLMAPLSGIRKGETAVFTVKIRPTILEMDRIFLLKFILRNPFDVAWIKRYSTSAACSAPEFLAEASGRPNVILVSMDTLRADALGCYGYQRNTSPTIDSFAAENVIFKKAFSQSTWTLPSHLSLLTSLYPTEFDRESLRYVPNLSDFTRFAGAGRSIAAETISSILNDSGYYCVAFTDGGLMSSFYGYHKGFHMYDERVGPENRSLKVAGNWLKENDDSTFFLFIHTYFIHRYSLDPKKNYEYSEEEIENLLTTIPEILPEFTGSAISDLRGRDFYDLRIRVFDKKLAAFLSLLKELKLYDNTLIILTSDHGESFKEVHDNGRVTIGGHGQIPYESQIWVPLIMKLPSRIDSGRKVVHEQVRLLDLAPTILAVLGLDPHPQFRGNSLMPFLDETESPDLFHVYSFSGHGGSVRTDGKKYIYREPDDREEFYDLVTDIHEMHNLALSRSKEMSELRKLYSNFIANYGEASFSKEPDFEAPPELRQQLRSLGYIQ